jgi:hypothetical protein
MSFLNDIVDKIFHPNKSDARQTNFSPMPPAPAEQPTDVEAILNELAKNQSQKLNWKTSVVDLLKLLSLDSSLDARKKLAQELHYSGDMANSAEMNVWLLHEVMKKLSENGGKVPSELLH